ncbi:MAG: hypothetical protein PHV65_05725 [Bacteroidales bacterium]|nr:hypothetical protein [Bacteroidales bacterium]
MDITNLIIGIVSFVLGIIILMWFIKKPIKFIENPKEKIGADDIVQDEKYNKNSNQEVIIACVAMIILGIIFIYKGITGV